MQREKEEIGKKDRKGPNFRILATAHVQKINRQANKAA